MRLNKFLSGLAAVLLAFSLCNAASAAPLTKIRTAWMDSYETFAMWYAKEKGWDKEAGLDIDILFFDSGMAILNALPAGEWQYSCLGGVPAMMGNLRYGTSVIGVGTDESACVAVLARPDNPVFKTKGLNPKHPGVFGSPEDVRGKTILCTTVSSAHFALTAWLDAVGVKPTEVTIKTWISRSARPLRHRRLRGAVGPAHVRRNRQGLEGRRKRRPVRQGHPARPCGRHQVRRRPP
ncbi:MAG: ABC transporter substrate-binding protein [Bilophila wadsworthia]